jgi:hypothetical protein
LATSLPSSSTNATSWWFSAQSIPHVIANDVSPSNLLHANV